MRKGKFLSRAGMSAIWKAGCLFGATGVLAGAFGAHGLKGFFGDDEIAKRKIDNWLTASHYQMVHSAALLATGLRIAGPSTAGILAGLLFAGGITAFSGSIYALVLIDNPKYKKILGPITPLGGLLFVAGWTCLAFV